MEPQIYIYVFDTQRLRERPREKESERISVHQFIPQMPTHLGLSQASSDAEAAVQIFHLSVRDSNTGVIAWVSQGLH